MDLSSVAKKLKENKKETVAVEKPVEKKVEAPKKQEKSAWEWSDANTRQALIQGIPMLLGAAIGGAEGGAIGGEAGEKAYAGYTKEKMDEAKLKNESDKTQWNREIEERKLDLQKKRLDEQSKYWQGSLRAKKDKDAPKTYQQKLESMGGEERKRFDNIRMGKMAVQRMADALSKGEDTFSLVGDNPYTLAASQWEEAIGRMQSGGAINDQEAKRFRALVPQAMDSKKIQVAKLQQMSQLMDQRLESFAINPQEVPNYVNPNFQQNLASYGTPQAPAGGGMFEAHANSKKRDVKQMSVDELKAELGEK